MTHILDTALPADQGATLLTVNPDLGRWREPKPSGARDQRHIEGARVCGFGLKSLPQNRGQPQPRRTGNAYFKRTL